jgi:hypothetical protein
MQGGAVQHAACSGRHVARRRPCRLRRL